jgi:hypothetical protein
MRSKRSLAGLIATVATASAILTGLTAVTIDTYHDMGSSTTVHSVSLAPGSPPADTSTDTYHDM